MGLLISSLRAEYTYLGCASADCPGARWDSPQLYLLPPICHEVCDVLTSGSSHIEFFFKFTSVFFVKYLDNYWVNFHRIGFMSCTGSVDEWRMNLGTPLFLYSYKQHTLKGLVTVLSNSNICIFFFFLLATWDWILTGDIRHSPSFSVAYTSLGLICLSCLMLLIKGCFCMHVLDCLISGPLLAPLTESNSS